MSKCRQLLVLVSTPNVVVALFMPGIVQSMLILPLNPISEAQPLVHLQLRKTIHHDLLPCQGLQFSWLQL